MATSLEAEQEAQRVWVPRERFAAVPFPAVLLTQEFAPPEEQMARQTKAITSMLAYAISTVPWYIRLAQRLRITRGDLTDPATLTRLPPLTTRQVQQHGRQLRSTRLPKNQKIEAVTRTSGTTGRPTTVYQSTSSRRPFNWLKQRELRWFRWDPRAPMASIRPGVELPTVEGDRHLGTGDVLRRRHWPRVGQYFQTGPFLAFTNTNPVDDQLAFLAREAPPYLLGQSSLLEHLALRSDTPPSDTLRAVQAISQTLTPAMERTVRERLGCEVDINYGFNEIGLIASRCREGGRYHVHAEHAHVELLDDAGQPAAPGTFGRIVVSGLTNYAMPLLRYEPGDSALVVEGPCPCGRTLPSFGTVLGRYRRTGWLPEGTWPRWGALQMAIHGLPAELKGSIERYQAHQHADHAWTFRLTLVRDTLSEIAPILHAAFQQAVEGVPAPPLSITAADDFARADTRKFQDFVSDFQPDPDLPDIPS